MTLNEIRLNITSVCSLLLSRKKMYASMRNRHIKEMQLMQQLHFFNYKSSAFGSTKKYNLL